MVWSVQSSNSLASDFAQASCQAAFLYNKDFYSQIFHISVPCKKVVPHDGHPGGQALTVAFIPVGDHQSMLTTTTGVSPSTELGGKGQTLF